MTGHWSYIVAAAGILLLASCSGTVSSHGPHSPGTSKSGSLPPYSQAARLRPCDSISLAELSKIVGNPAHLDELGDVGQKPMLSSGPVLPKVWIATCSWVISKYPNTSLYLQIELAPTPAGAELDFKGIHAGMGLKQPVTREAGYGEEVVFGTDSHRDVTIIVRQGAKIVTLEFNPSPQPKQHALTEAVRMRMAQAMMQLVLKKE